MYEVVQVCIIDAMKVAMPPTDGNSTFRVAFALAWTLIAGCKEDAPRVVAPRPLVRPPMFAPVPVRSATTFDLVATADGALLVWASSDATQSSIRAQRLDGDGAPSGASSVVDSRQTGPVDELVAATSAGRLGVAWIESASSPPHVHTTFGGVRAEAFAPAEDLGESVTQSSGLRGRLVLAAAEDGALTLAYRIPADDCYARDGVCERYMHRRLGVERASDRTPMDRMEVRESCEPFLFGSVWTSGTWYSGVCSTEPEAMIPVIVVRPAISYAAPNNGPEGCTPLGIVALPDGAVAVSECGNTRVYRRINLEGRTIAQAAGPTPVARCPGGHLQLSAESDAPAQIVLTPTAPQSRIEWMLPVDMVGRQGRAVWTGATALVAREVGGALRLSSMRCDGEHLVIQNAS